MKAAFKMEINNLVAAANAAGHGPYLVYYSKANDSTVTYTMGDARNTMGLIAHLEKSGDYVLLDDENAITFVGEVVSPPSPEDLVAAITSDEGL